MKPMQAQMCGTMHLPLPLRFSVFALQGASMRAPREKKRRAMASSQWPKVVATRSWASPQGGDLSCDVPRQLDS